MPAGRLKLAAVNSETGSMNSLDQAFEDEPGSLLARSLDGAMPQAFPITATPHDGSVEGNPPCVSLHLLSPLPAGTAPTRSSFRKEVLEVSTASAAVRRACRSQATAPSVTSTP